MLWRRIIAAADESDAGRQAVRTAVELASRCSAQLRILRVIPVNAPPRLAGVAEGAGVRGVAGDDPEVEHLRRWLEADVLRASRADQVGLGVAYGLPGIEICRYADEYGADLVVLGRKRHSHLMRILMGDTADAVARRNRCASLFVPQRQSGIRRILAAVDTSTRGFNVVEAACDVALQTGASLTLITVERVAGNEPPHPVSSPPLGASISLQGRVHEVLARKALPDVPLIIRRGEIVECVLAEALESEADLLAVGYHRGGPPGVLEAGSTGRRLAHTASCAVLTIPL
jgi:nucleotide-binding universal stress UspA family protein